MFLTLMYRTANNDYLYKYFYDKQADSAGITLNSLRDMGTGFFLDADQDINIGIIDINDKLFELHNHALTYNQEVKYHLNRILELSRDEMLDFIKGMQDKKYMLILELLIAALCLADAYIASHSDCITLHMIMTILYNSPNYNLTQKLKVFLFITSILESTITSLKDQKEFKNIMNEHLCSILNIQNNSLFECEMDRIPIITKELFENFATQEENNSHIINSQIQNILHIVQTKDKELKNEISERKKQQLLYFVSTCTGGGVAVIEYAIHNKTRGDRGDHD